MDVLTKVKSILYGVLQVQGPRRTFDRNTALIGAIPEFDSMAVISIITALEESFGFAVDDDEIDASIFETVGTLLAFVECKLQG